ncbi:hypothetical protein VSR69_38995 [Paraburkholderia phytofirmans]|uniref:hypothetical protein n=1 Tax=Paraburkholderia sp. BL9I2N2 TaxID=1938809 RepID=UPI0031774155
MLKTLHEALQTAAIGMKVVAAHGDARDMLRAEGLEDRLGLIDRRNPVADSSTNSIHEKYDRRNRCSRSHQRIAQAAVG